MICGQTTNHRRVPWMTLPTYLPTSLPPTHPPILPPSLPTTTCDYCYYYKYYSDYYHLLLLLPRRSGRRFPYGFAMHFPCD
jgi:hypothetical protein